MTTRMIPVLPIPGWHLLNPQGEIDPNHRIDACIDIDSGWLSRRNGRTAAGTVDRYWRGPTWSGANTNGMCQTPAHSVLILFGNGRTGMSSRDDLADAIRAFGYEIV